MKKTLFKKLKERIPPQLLMQCLHDAVVLLAKWIRNRINGTKDAVDKKKEELIDFLKEEEGND